MDRTKHVSVITVMILRRSVKRSLKIVHYSGSSNMMRTSAPKSTAIETDKYKIALDSGDTTHVMNAHF